MQSQVMVGPHLTAPFSASVSHAGPMVVGVPHLSKDIPPCFDIQAGFGRWTAEEDATLRKVVQSHGAHNWKRYILTMTHTLNFVNLTYSSYCSLLFPNNVQPLSVPNRIAAIAFCGKRSDVQCLHRWKKVIQPGIVKGPWTPTEDEILNLAVEQAGGVR